MAAILVLAMGAAERRKGELDGLRQAGHEVTVVEPRFPECQPAVLATRPALVAVDGSHAPSHGRATARWLATQSGFRSTPFVFLDVEDRDVARTKKELPRAQFARWAALLATAERLARRT